MFKYLATLAAIAVASILVLETPAVAGQSAQASPEDAAMCTSMLRARDLTLTQAMLVPASRETPEYSYIQGIISGRIRFHMQLPLQANWNGRLLNIGDGGKDGDLDWADHRLGKDTPWRTRIPAMTQEPIRVRRSVVKICPPSSISSQAHS